jgi:hypothetical protein
MGFGGYSRSPIYFLVKMACFVASGCLLVWMAAVVDGEDEQFFFLL